jgi:hypothetical protein
MAISQIGFGLKPINKTGSNYNAAQVSEYTTIGGPVYPAAFQSPIAVNNGYGATGVRAIYFSSNKIDGSFVGAQYNDTNGKPVFTDHYTVADVSHLRGNPGSGLNDSFTQFCTDDPYQLYLIKTNLDLTLSSINLNFFITNPFEAGSFSPDGKRSQVKIAGGQVLVSTFPLQFVSLGTGADDIQTSKDTGYNVEDAILDAGSNIIVRLNQAKYLQNTRPRNN